MGGGDLNLKKSWHTQTMRNLEKVWKAEQRSEDEKRRMEQLAKERRDDRERQELRRIQEESGQVKPRAERLDWMYSGPNSQSAVDEEREAFLLGKIRVDRQRSSASSDLHLPSAPQNALGLKQYTGITVENQERDMMNKMREDPLFAIKMIEKQSLDKVISNPVKMKQIKETAVGSSSNIGTTKRDDRRRSRSPSRQSRSTDNYHSRYEDGRRENTSRRRSRSPPHSQRPASSSDYDRMAKLERMKQNAEALKSQRQEDLNKIAEHDSFLKENAPIESKRFFRMGETVGSSMSQGALHDNIRRKMGSISRSGRDFD